MRHVSFAAAVVGALLALPVSVAQAALLIEVNKSAQQMTVSQDGVEMFVWPVSTGTTGYDTPSGEFKPFRMEKDHFSREWDDAPMPNSIFFTQQGHAIHGTSHVKALGTPASHGCVRLSVEHSEMLWRLVKQEKMANTRVVLTGVAPPPPPAPPVASAPGAKPKVQARAAPQDGTAGVAPDDDFTGALRPMPPRDIPQQRLAPREDTRYRIVTPPGAVDFDGRYFYDRRGRRIAEVPPGTRGVPWDRERDRRWVYGRDAYERAQRDDFTGSFAPRRRYAPGWDD